MVRIPLTKFLEHPEKLEMLQGLSAKNRGLSSPLRPGIWDEMVLAKLANYGIPNKLAFQIPRFWKSGYC